MRIQIAPLTPTTIGDHTETPFILILDNLTEDETEELLFHDGALVHQYKATTGARTVLVSTSPIDVGTLLELTEEQSERLAQRLTKPDPDDANRVGGHP